MPDSQDGAGPYDERLQDDQDLLDDLLEQGPEEPAASQAQPPPKERSPHARGGADAAVLGSAAEPRRRGSAADATDQASIALDLEGFTLGAPIRGRPSFCATVSWPI